MKLQSIFFSAFAASVLLLGTGCSNDEDPIEFPPLPEPETKGFFVVNAGQYYSSTTGSLGYYNYETGTMSSDIFYQATGTYVGDTFNDGYIYGNQIWLAVTGSAVLHVLDLNTFELIKTIQPSTAAGPRHITSLGEYIYCTLFNDTPGTDGYVCRIDPQTFECTTVAVGPQPEYIVAHNGMLYVAVSDGYSYSSPNPYAASCVAVIDPSTFTVTQKITGLINPVQLVTNGNRLFVQSSGQYNSSYQQIDYGIYEIIDNRLSTTVLPGNYMAISRENLYFIDSPYSYLNTTGTYQYYVMNLASGSCTKWIDSSDGVYDPAGLAIDPNTLDVVLLSYREGAYGYPDYSINGYLNIYSADGKLLTAEVETGIGPTTAFFRISE